MINWKDIFHKLRNYHEKNLSPSVTFFSDKYKDPYHVLVSTIISLRTKDEVTTSVSEKLFTKADNFKKLSLLNEDEIAGLIYPAGFYKVKSVNLKKISEIIIIQHKGKVPKNRESLLQLPGVGLKTANLVMSLAFNEDYICVDIHVHRISNRTGWIKSKTPEETEIELMKILPKEHWIEINTLLVLFGQKICRPVSPYCSKCFLTDHCKRINVNKSR